MIKYNQTKLENCSVKKIGKELNKMNKPDELDKTIEKIRDRIEREIPDKGYFRNFAEDFKNNDKNVFAKAISISVERDETIDGNALLVIAALHPQMNMDSSIMLKCGKRKDLVEYMKQDNFKSDVQEAISRLSDSLKNY